MKELRTLKSFADEYSEWLKEKAHVRYIEVVSLVGDRATLFWCIGMKSKAEGIAVHFESRTYSHILYPEGALEWTLVEAREDSPTATVYSTENVVKFPGNKRQFR